MFLDECLVLTKEIITNYKELWSKTGDLVSSITKNSADKDKPNLIQMESYL